MIAVIISSIIMVINAGLLITDILLARKFQKEEEAKDIDRFYIICPCCGKKINLSQTHVYLEDETNDRN